MKRQPRPPDILRKSGVHRNRRRLTGRERVAEEGCYPGCFYYSDSCFRNDCKDATRRGQIQRDEEFCPD